MPALGLTDHLGMSGALNFYQACMQRGIQPILGLEIDLIPQYHLSTLPHPQVPGRLVLLAEDAEGWRNLCRLSSSLLVGRETEGSLCSLDHLSRFARGLVCLTGGNLGPLHQLLEMPGGREEGVKLLSLLRDIFPGRLYVEIDILSAKVLKSAEIQTQMAVEMGLPQAAAHPVFYLTPGQEGLQQTVSAIREIVPRSRLAPGQVAPPGAYFVPPAMMEEHLQAFPAAFEGTAEIVDRCRVNLELGKPHYPQVPLPPGMKAIDLLRQKAHNGALRLYPHTIENALIRLEQELSVIEARGYETIFLIAEDMISYSRNHGIPSASRGSASSSLVAHCTGITTPDPLELDLYFERFLNPARATPPDIDTDFCSRRRDEIIRHLFETFGEDRVAMVGTVNTFRDRSALGEVAKAYGLNPTEVRALTGKLHRRYYRPTADETTGEGPAEKPYAELIAEYGHRSGYAKIFREAAALVGIPHHLSVHPGGVVIAPGPIVEYAPITRSGGKGMIITQFDLNNVEQAGLVKLDLLGIRGLTVIGDVAERIYSWSRKEYQIPYAIIDAVPDSDPETSTTLASGQTIGCFQIESPGMRSTLKDIQARSINDLMAALALYRPGPLKGGLRDAFVRRHKGEEAVTHIHPALSGLLAETYGVILYQEQVLRIAHQLAGFSLAEADLLRRAMSHFDPGKQMQALKEKFIQGMEAREKIDPETGENIWEMMAAFAGYGFPKAHAASYAHVAWHSTWCKTHYPEEFLAAVLANWGGYYPQSVYLNEARRLKIKVFPPHINHSSRQFSVSYPQGEPVLYMGLDQVRDLTRSTQEKILRHRPYHSLAEFVANVDPRRVEIENLIKAGALEGLGTIPGLLCELETSPHPGQLSLFSLHAPSSADWTLEQKNAAQQHILNASLAAHPLELIPGKIREAGAINTFEASAKVGQTVRVAGLRQTLFRTRSEGKRSMAFLTLEDMEGMLEVVLFPEVYRRARALLSGSPVPLLIEGEIERDATSGESILMARKVEKLA